MSAARSRAGGALIGESLQPNAAQTSGAGRLILVASYCTLSPATQCLVVQLLCRTVATLVESSIANPHQAKCQHAKGCIFEAGLDYVGSKVKVDLEPNINLA